MEEHLGRYAALVQGDSPQRIEDFARVCAARAETRPDLLPTRPQSARDCKTCGGTGETTKPAHYRIEVDGIGTLCGDCVGRGWKRNPFVENANPVQDLFRRCWTEVGFSTRLVESPREVLDDLGLSVTDKVALEIAEDRHGDWCWGCQLSFARIDVTPGLPDSDDASSSLERLLASEPREGVLDGSELAAIGLTLSHNITVRIVEGDEPRLAMVVGHPWHICACGEMDLLDLIAPGL